MLLCAAAAEARAQQAPTNQRDGFMIAVALGPGGYRGFGDIENTQGGGGMFILRFGTKATDTIQFLVEFDIGAYITKVELLDGSEQTLFNRHALTVLALQWYATDVFWVRSGVGLANFRQGEEQNSPAIDKTGLGLMSGVGYDVFRRGIFAFDIELNVTTGIYSGGALLHSGLFLGFNWY